MLDDFREQANAAPFLEDEDDLDQFRTPPPRQFLGMTPLQRFVIALMLLIITCVLSTFCLLITERIVLPFM